MSSTSKKAPLQVAGELTRYGIGTFKPNPDRGPVVGILLDVDYLISAALRRDRMPDFERIAATIAGPCFCEPTACIADGGGVPATDLERMFVEELGFRVVQASPGAHLVPHLLVEGIRTLQWPGIEELCVVSRNPDLSVLAQEAALGGQNFSVARYDWTPSSVLEERASRVILLGDWHAQKVITFEMTSSASSARSTRVE